MMIILQKTIRPLAMCTGKYARTAILICDGVNLFTACYTKNKYEDWKQYRGSDESIHCSSLTEPDTSSITLLQPAWIYHTGDAGTASHLQVQCKPVIIDCSGDS